MPIRLYLAGRTFDPEITQTMSIAFQGVWTRSKSCHQARGRPPTR
jgi:hypothetical protein